ncbi:MAG: hypothetical protein RLZ10_2167 [Bacteroidota bacterium]|jgi:hypothetical protein
MKLKFEPGNEYFYIVFGKIEFSRLRFVSLDLEGIHYHFTPYTIDEEKIFESKKDAERYLKANEKQFLENSVQEARNRVLNTRLVIKANAKNLVEQEIYLSNLEKKLAALNKKTLTKGD